jgi:hypothetical protein
VSRYPKIQTRQSKGVAPSSDVAVLDQCSFEDRPRGSPKKG